MHDVNINRVAVSNKVPFGKKGFKCFTGYKDDSDHISDNALMHDADICLC